MKKVIALMLALALTCGAAALADYPAYFNETGYPICNEIVTITAAGHRRSTPDWNATMMTEQLEKRLGIHIDGKGYEKTEWPTQFTLMLATDTLPDIIGAGMKGKIDIGTAIKYGEEGYFMDFSQYDSLMPNRVAFFEEHPDYARYLTTGSGAIYGYAIYNNQGPASSSYTAISWNVDWLEKAGLEYPTTRDEMYNALVAFRDADMNGNGEDDEIPMEYSLNATDKNSIGLRVLWGFGILSQDVHYAIIANDDGTVALGNATEEYRDYLRFMNKLFAEGLLEPDCATVTGEEQAARGRDNRYGLKQGGASYDDVIEMGLTENPLYPTTSAFTAEKDDPRITVLTSAVKPEINVLASATTEYPEVVARFLDYFFDCGEGSDSSMDGWEGVNYDVIENEYGAIVKDFSKYRGDMDDWTYRSQVACIYEAFTMMYRGWEWYDNVPIEDLLDTSENAPISNNDTFNLWRVAAMREEGLVSYQNFPPLPYTTEEATRRSILYTDIRNYNTTMHASFILGDANLDTDWDAYVAQLKAMGLDELMTIEQAAYDRLMGKA